MIFMKGDFSLEEANNYALEAFDTESMPDQDHHFSRGRGEVGIASLALSANEIPQDLLYIIDTFSSLDFIDEYTYSVAKYITDTFLRMAKEKAEFHKKMQERAKRTHRKNVGGEGSRSGMIINPYTVNEDNLGFSGQEYQCAPLMFD